MRACIRAPLVRPRRDHRPHQPNTPRGDTRRPIFLQENQHLQPLTTTSPSSPLHHASATVQQLSVRAGTSLHACISAARVSDPSTNHLRSQPPAPKNPRYPNPKNRTNVSHLFLSFLLCLRARAQGPGPTPVPRRGPLMRACIMGHPRRPAADVTVRSRNRTQRGPHYLFTLSPRAARQALNQALRAGGSSRLLWRCNVRLSGADCAYDLPSASANSHATRERLATAVPICGSR